MGLENMLTKISIDCDYKYEYEQDDYLGKHELDILLYYARKVKGNFIEIGCNKGLTTKALSKVCEGIVYAIDYSEPTNPEQQYECVDLFKHCLNIENVKCYNKNSQTMDYSKMSNIVLAFIDADHTYEGVKKDFENMKKLIKNGYIIFHDYSPETTFCWNGVANFIDELALTREVLLHKGTMMAVVEVKDGY
jgi:SAM-dependent methyltransferase